MEYNRYQLTKVETTKHLAEKLKKSSEGIIWLTRPSAFPNKKFIKPVFVEKKNINSLRYGGYISQYRYTKTGNKKEVFCIYSSNFMNYYPHYIIEDYDPNNPEGENTMTNTLFSIKGTDKFCHRIGTNRDGNAVVEIQGANGAIEIVNPKLLEEVTPYTVAIQFPNNKNNTYDYLCTEGAVSKGELLVVNDQIAVVVGVDTKNKSAHKWLKGRKVPTEPFDTTPEG